MPTLVADINPKGNQTTTDAKGNLTAFDFERLSGGSRVNPDTGLLEPLWGKWDQLIDTTTGQNPTDADSWWSKTRVTINSDGGVVASNDVSTSHYLYKSSVLSADATHVFSAKVKAGAVDWIRLRVNDDAGWHGAYFNLATGVKGTETDLINSTVSEVDVAGYYQIGITVTTTTVSGANAIRIYPAEGDGDINFTGDGSTASVYVKEIMLEELPSGLAYGPELFDAETLGSELVTDGDMEDDPTTNWTGSNVTDTKETTIKNSGTASLKQIDTGGGALSKQTVTTEAGKVYYAEAYARADSGNSGLSAARFEASDGGAWNGGIAYMDLPLADDTFQKLSFYFIATDTSTYINLWCQNTTDDITYWDDVVVKKVTAPDKSIPDKDPWPALAGSEAITDSDNQDFDDGTINEWTIQDNSTDSTVAYDGTALGFANESGDDKQGKLTVDETTDPCTFAYFRLTTSDWTCTANTLHRIEALVAVPAANTLKDAKIRTNGQSGAIATDSSISLSDDTWTTISSYIYIAADNTGAIEIGFDGDPADGDILYIDNISIRPVQTSWLPYGTNTIEIDETEDALKITWVDNANGASLLLSDAKDLSSDLTVGSAYTVNIDIKYSGAGDGVDIQLRGGPVEDSSAITETASYTTVTLNFVATHASTNYINFGDMESGESVYIRNFSIKEIPHLLHQQNSVILPSDYVNASSTTAETRIEADGLGMLGDNVIQLLEYTWDFDEWTASNTTPVKDITGPDGIANSATTLTADAGNGTLKYTPSASENTDYCFPIWMKRITGTGNVDLTDDDGGSWTTKTLTTSWQRFYVTQSQADPVVGIRIVTSGDEVGIFGANLTATTYPVPYGEANGSPVLIKAESGSYTMSTAFKNLMGDVADSPFTMICEWTPRFNYDESVSVNSVISVSGSSYSLFYHSSNGVISVYPGGDASEIDINYIADTTYLVAVRVYDDSGTMKCQLGYSDDDGVSWTWDETPIDYDGSFSPGSGFILGLDNEYPFHIGRIRLWDEAWTVAQIEDGVYNGSGSGSGRGLLGMTMHVK